jgi:AcrR family transcriptional regulator
VTDHEGGSRASINDLIVEATLAIISRDGLGAITMKAIAETAGVSRQTLYNHYPDVDTIVAEAIARHNDDSIRLLESALQLVDDAEGRLTQIVRHMVMIGAHAHHAPGLEHGLSERARAKLNEHDEWIDGCIRDVLDQGQRDASFRDDIDLDIDTVLVRHLLAGLTEQAARSPDDAATIALIGTRTLLAAVAAH